MFDAPFGRTHTLASRRDDRRVFCGSEGLFVGPVPLLESAPHSCGARHFAPRPLAEVNRDLERCYGLPVDASAIEGAIAAVARALNDGDPARACIAAVFLRLPDIPEASPQALLKCATALAERGLLKADPNDPKHPGYPAGAPDGKGGQFRPKAEAERSDGEADVDQLVRGVLTRAAVRLAKRLIADVAAGVIGSVFGPEVAVAETAKLIFDLGYGAYEIAREIAPYVKAYYDAPKTLDELREAAKTKRVGYDMHHVIERATAAPDGSEDELIDGADNLVSIPTLKHWRLNGWYGKENDKFGRQTPRQYLKRKSVEERRQVGLEGLKAIGVLKP